MPSGRFIDRRAFLAAGLAAGACATAPAAPLLERHGRKLGIQMYALGPDAYRDLPATFAAIAKIGYQTVQMGVQGDAAQTRAALDAAGLACTSVHIYLVATDAAAMERTAAQTAAFAKTVGAKYAATSIPPIAPRNFQPQAGDTQIQTLMRAVKSQTSEDWANACSAMNAFGERLQKDGIGFAYHNHNFEFAKYGDGTLMDAILAGTDPALVKLEIDVGWVASAGLDPQAFIAKHADRARLLHIKDIKASTKPNFDLQLDPTEVGSGMLNWPAILKTAISSGVDHFYVEQEPPFTRPEIEAAQISYSYLSQLR